ncbi:MAG: hypothetical protein RL021_1916 [Bacteroidota bacterium]|jgi:ribosomal protein S18 acetylase RimI-like enzyme
MNIRWRIADQNDAETVAALSHSTFVEMWQPFYTPQDMQVYTKEAFSLPAILSLLSKPEIHRFVLAEMDNEFAGYAKITLGSSLEDFPGASVMEIERFYLFRKYHGTGIAQALMDYILKEAEARGMEWIFLGVDVNNHRAIRFYSRYGFEVYGRKDFRVGTVVDTDQLMRRRVVIA